MKKLKKWLPSKRKLMQLYFALLFNANLKGYITGNIYRGSTKNVCVPGMNCYSCPGAIGACPLGSLQGAFSADRSTLYYVGGILLLYGVMFGRMICGWLCGFGLIQELLYKIKTPKLPKSPVTRLLSYLKYVLLVVFVFLIPILYAFKDTPLPAFCKYICPSGTLEGGLGLLANKVNASYFSMLGPLFTWKFLLMVSILVGCVFIFRLFCRFLCPIGALYGLFHKISIFGIKLDQSKCIDCGKCISHCKVDIHHVGDQECVSCGECIDVCPTQAIKWKGSNIFIKVNDIPQKTSKARTVTRIISAVLMVAILVGAICYYWAETPDPIVPPDNPTPDSTDPVVKEGYEIGNLCYGYDLQIIDGNGISTETINPSKTGKITIINFWGTWCTPCVNELPYFDQIATEYEDEVTVIAIHTHTLIETAPPYLKEHYPNSKIIFATDYLAEDATTNGYYATLGGRGMYPYTLILDENGIVVASFLSSVEYEQLKEVVEQHLSSVDG